MKKAHDCSDCRHWRPLVSECRKGHKPRFYLPRTPLDRAWGHKRRCGEFEGVEEGKEGR